MEIRNKIDLIKRVRDTNGWGLKECKDAVEVVLNNIIPAEPGDPLDQKVVCIPTDGSSPQIFTTLWQAHVQGKATGATYYTLLTSRIECNSPSTIWIGKSVTTLSEGYEDGHRDGG